MQSQVRREPKTKLGLIKQTKNSFREVERNEFTEAKEEKGAQEKKMLNRVK